MTKSELKRYEASTGILRTGRAEFQVKASGINPQTQVRVRKKLKIKGTIDDALKLQEQMVSDIEAAQTVAGFARDWLRWKEKTGAKPSYMSTMKCILTRHVLPRWGEEEILGIRRLAVERWLVECSNQPNPRKAHEPWSPPNLYEPGTVNSWGRALQTLVAAAYHDWDMGESPIKRVKRVTVPRRSLDAPNILTAEQLRPFLRLAKKKKPKLFPMVFLGFTTGLRFSELSALRWDDIGYGSGLLRVVRSQSVGVVGTTKTRSSYRTLALVTLQLQILEEHRQRQIDLGYSGRGGERMFPGGARGGFVDLRSLITLFAWCCKRMDPPIEHRVTTHAMRRTFNNLLRQRGVDRVVLHSLTGHSSDAMTELYSVVEVSEKAKAVGMVVDLLV